MNAETIATEQGSNIRSADLVGPAPAVNLVTAVMGIVVGLTFGNVLALRLRLGVPI
ncbi:hypothetical protein [Candidatus Protofrankia californiensis]|uniref:hypothetical protein n=1 Tax=Candidatus Protofrankia californiensis TaxID=1839754 RepID=UPI0032046E03